MEEGFIDEGDDFDGVAIGISDDKMEVTMCVYPREEGYTVSLLRARLREMGVTHGIKDDVLKELAENPDGDLVTVAEGIQSVQGKDGWYEFFFDTEYKDKPKILDDGSVDYSLYGNMPSVEEGDTLAVYHHPEEGRDGVNVFGEYITAMPGKNLPRLSGVGVVSLDDGETFVARYGGKILYDDGRINIEKELIITGDVSNTTGDVFFRNDIHIYGNVTAGMKVVSEKGGIVVDGSVESATLKAAKDITIKNGMQGNEVGIVQAGGNVSSRFFELTTVKAGGSISTNSIMNCNIYSGEDVEVAGKFGAIVGGEIEAKREISASLIGNDTGIETKLIAGAPGDVAGRIMVLKSSISSKAANIDKMEETLEKLDDDILKYDLDEYNQKKMELTRKKVATAVEMNNLTKELRQQEELYSKSREAKVTVFKTVFPGTFITINGRSVEVEDEQNYVEYYRRGKALVAMRIGD